MRLFLGNVKTKIVTKQIFVIDFVLDTNPWMYKIEDLEKKYQVAFMKKNCY